MGGFLRKGQKNEEQQDGSVVEAVVRKESEKVKYGIVFHRSKPNFPTTIEFIRPKCLFHRTGLLPGMYVLEVNGEDATWKSPKDSARLLKSAPVGSNLSVKATMPKTISVTKESQETSWGFSIKNSKTREGIFVDNVTPGSVMASSGVEHGMMILKINGKPFPDELKEVAQAIRENGNSLEITVVQLESAIDIDLDDCSAATDVQEADDEIEAASQQAQTASGTDVEEDSRDKLDQPQESIETDLEEYSSHLKAVSNTKKGKARFGYIFETNYQKKEATPILQTVTENREVMKSTEDCQPLEVVQEMDMDDFSYAEGENKESPPSRNDENNPSGSWFFKKTEEECYDLDDQFPERYTENNNSVFLSVTSNKQSGPSEVMSQVMQLRKLRQPIPKLPVVMSPEAAPVVKAREEETDIVARKKRKLSWLPMGRNSKSPIPAPEDELLNRRAVLFGLKKEAKVATIHRFDPKGRRPRFFSLFSGKSKSEKDKLVSETNGRTTTTTIHSLFDMLLSFQDTLCTSLVSCSTPDSSTLVADDTKYKAEADALELEL